jgi:outer membrane protein
MRLFLINIFLLCCLIAQSQNSIQFKSLDEVFAYADSHSSTFKTAAQQSILAKYQTLAAKLAQFNFQGNVVFSSTDNTTLPVSYIPAEIFGGPAGSFKQITLGQQYVSLVNINPQFDILSPYAAAKVKVSKAYEKLTEVNNLLTKKSLYESVAAAYCNILSYQWQIKVTQKSLANADTLVQIMQKKQLAGIARAQDVNNALANQLNTQDKLQQLEILLAQQYNSLKILCDIDVATAVAIGNTEKPIVYFDVTLAATGHLQQSQNEWQKKYEVADWLAAKKFYMPALSAVGNLAWQQNSNKQFYDNSRWNGSNYIGLKLTIPIVPDANKLATVKYDRINIAMADINLQHAILEDSINNQQLQLDYKKAFKSYELAEKIELLKEDTYTKNLNIYKEGILSATDLINSFIDLLNSSLNTVSQLANSEYSKSKIIINNTVK